MSRRFGRQQKRKMRKAIEDLQLTRESCWIRIRSLEIEMQANRIALRRIAVLLGQHFLGLPAKNMSLVTDVFPDFVKLAQSMLPQEFMSLAESDQRHIIDRAAYVLDMYPVEVRRDTLQGMVHVYVGNSQHKVGYALSAQAYMSISAEQLAEQICRPLAVELKRNPHEPR
jgi:hypothetical protein